LLIRRRDILNRCTGHHRQAHAFVRETDDTVRFFVPGFRYNVRPGHKPASNLPVNLWDEQMFARACDPQCTKTVFEKE
jgi:hypothetical protein